MSTWRLRSGGSLCPPEHNFCCAGSLCPALILAIILVAHFSDNSCCAGSLCPALVSGFPCFTRYLLYHALLCSDGSPCPFTAKLATNAYSYVRTGHRARSPQSWLQTLILMFGRVTVPVHRKVGYKRLFKRSSSHFRGLF